MKKLLMTSTLSVALVASALAGAAEQSVPAGAPMPVLYQAVANGATYPVLAKDGDRYFQVFIYPKGQPYFTDSAGQWHFVSNAARAENFSIYYVDGRSNHPLAVPKGKNDEAVHDVLVSGGDEVKDTLICWYGLGWYGYSYVPYYNYCYYPSYSYGSAYGGSYYGGYNDYYGGGYGGYYSDYGYYGYGQPNYYSGYGCVMNDWYW